MIKYEIAYTCMYHFLLFSTLVLQSFSIKSPHTHTQTHTCMYMCTHTKQHMHTRPVYIYIYTTKLSYIPGQAEACKLILLFHQVLLSVHFPYYKTFYTHTDKRTHVQGTVIKKKQDLHRLAEANRAFAHFRW